MFTSSCDDCKGFNDTRTCEDCITAEAKSCDICCSISTCCFCNSNFCGNGEDVAWCAGHEEWHHLACATFDCYESDGGSEDGWQESARKKTGDTRSYEVYKAQQKSAKVSESLESTLSSDEMDSPESASESESESESESSIAESPPLGLVHSHWFESFSE